MQQIYKRTPIPAASDYAKNRNTSHRIDMLQRLFNFQGRPLKFTLNVVNKIPPKS